MLQFDDLEEDEICEESGDDVYVDLCMRPSEIAAGRESLHSRYIAEWICINISSSFFYFFHYFFLQLFYIFFIPIFYFLQFQHNWKIAKYNTRPLEYCEFFFFPLFYRWSEDAYMNEIPFIQRECMFTSVTRLILLQTNEAKKKKEKSTYCKFLYSSFTFWFLLYLFSDKIFYSNRKNNGSSEKEFYLNKQNILDK